MKLLGSGLALNPYHFLLVDSAQETAATPQAQIAFWKQFSAAVSAAKGKPGCPTEGLYNTTVKNRMFARIAKMPVPEDKKAAAKVLAVLESEKCDDQKLLEAYRSGLKGT